MSVGYVPGNPQGPGQQQQQQDPYRGMLAQAGQGPGQGNYMAALSQGNPSYGAMGMPSNGQGPPPNFQQRMGQALTQMGRGPQQGQGAPGQPGQANPFMAAIARLHAQRQQGQGQPGANPLAGMLNGVGGGAQWGPNPMPQGMRGPGMMPPQQAPQQQVQWGQMPPGGGGMQYPTQGGGGNGP